jgi:hypothetical protein
MIRIRVGSLKALNVSAMALTIRSPGMAVLAARTLAASMYTTFASLATPVPPTIDNIGISPF